MSRSRTPPLPAAVLHDVTLQIEPRTLIGRGVKTQVLPAAAKSPGLVLPQHAEGSRQSGSMSERGKDHAPSMDAPAHPQSLALTSSEEAQSQGYKAGFELGKAEGFREGLELGQKKGVAQGLTEGRELGTQEVLRQANASREAMAERIAHLDQLFKELPAQLAEQFKERLATAEDDMIALCYSVICKILGDKFLRRESVAQSVRQAIEQCCGSGHHSGLSGLLAVHINPRDLETLRRDPGLSTWLEQNGAGVVPWVPDEVVELGGCIVRSNQGSLDARLETQLTALRELLSMGAITKDAPPSIPLKERVGE